MKEFRKTDNKEYICEECGKIFKNLRELSKHITLYHENTKIYFDNWLKENDDNFCKICKNKTVFLNIKNGYNKTCSKNCSLEKTKQTCNKKYGVEYISQLNSIKDKKKQTSLKHFGVENPNQSKIIKNKKKQTIKERYGKENYVNIEKSKQTCLQKYGVEYAFQSEEIKEKKKQTCFKNYGVEYPHQNKEIFEKGQKTRLALHKFKDTDIWYQGSYELDFLEKYYNTYPDIQKTPSVKYMFNGKNKIYHPDFYIPSINLIIEIKSLYLMNKDKNQNKEKEKASIIKGYNYIMIVNKNYKEFDNKIKSMHEYIIHA